jgi:hypothetical protein
MARGKNVQKSHRLFFKKNERKEYVNAKPAMQSLVFVVAACQKKLKRKINFETRPEKKNKIDKTT